MFFTSLEVLLVPFLLNSYEDYDRKMCAFCILKGTVSVILSDLLCKDGNARFTKVPLKPLSDQ